MIRKQVRMTPPPTPGSTPGSAPGSPDTTTQDECGQLIELLTAQRDLYRALDTLSGKQQDIIAHGQAEQLLGVLSERQVIVDQLTAINQNLAPLRSRMTEIADAAAEEKRQSLRSLVDQVQALLASIIARDDEDRQKLEASKAKVGKELSRVNTAPAAINAYRANAAARGARGAGRASSYATGGARFTDSRG